MKNKISKENFTEAIEEIKKSIKYQKELNNFFKTHNADGFIFQPDCCNELIKILHILFEKDDDNLIYNFCNKEVLVNQRKKGSIKQFNYTKNHFNTAEELYDYLINNKQEANSHK